MMRPLLSTVLVCLAAAGSAATHPAAATWEHAEGRAVTFEAADGVTIHGDLYMAGDSKAGPLLLLFHQGGGDARGEYAPLVGRLIKAGFSTLAIDQRVGGTRLGGVNRTMAAAEARGGAKETSYCAAYPDLVAALTYAESQGFTGQKIAWGSSYSGALVFRLAAEHGKRLAGVIAFSPASGEPMEGCRAEQFVEDVSIPAFALKPASEMERESSKVQMEIFREAGFRTHVADPGVHGSSMLNPARVEGSVEKTWDVVLAFLRETAGSGAGVGAAAGRAKDE